MFKNGFKSFMPSFITIAFELMEHMKRDSSHNSNIRKLNKTNEQLGVIEHMLVRLEKKIQNNRDLVDNLKFQVYLIGSINFLVLAAILLKVFGVF